MQENLGPISLARASLNCSVFSILFFAIVIIGVSVGILPRYSHDPDLFIIISFCISVFIALLGVVIGVTAFLKSRRSGDQQIERKRAIAGITASLLISILLLFVLIYVYKDRPSRGRLGRDTAAIEALRTIHMGQGEFLRLKGRLGTLKELADAGLIEKKYATGKPVYGYIYSETDLSPDTYCVHADRESGKSGYRDYNVTESGEIRYIESETNETVPRDGGRRMQTAPE
jgi:hypothetical protein